MFKNHPKGLIAASLANMGERFGFYIMMAILTLFISAKFGLSEQTTGYVYSAFYASIYLLALVGGVIADRSKKYKATIVAGLVIMALGYVLIAIPTPTPVPNLALYLTLTCVGLGVIAFGNGLFKGNLQVLIGQMYDDPRYQSARDAGFQIFYMFINIGGIFAPFMAVGIRNWWLGHNGFDYSAELPALCHQYLREGANMPAQAMENLQSLASKVSLDNEVTDLQAFVGQYLDVFNRGFHYAFIAAVVMICVSMVIFLINQKKFPDPSKKEVATKDGAPSQNEVQMSAAEIKQRIYALFAVFGVVIFFWMSFHQNGYSLTYFARDYVDLSVIKIDLGFTVIKGAEIFQSVNPLIVVCLTPLVMYVFGRLREQGKEPSAPRKIAIGMGIAALAYVFLMVCSLGLPDQSTLGGMTEAAKHEMLLTPWVMVGMYFILTLAELFISPLGLSFVSKVAPPHLQGVMQGAWLAATALGNSLLFIGGILYTSVPLWACWLVFVGACAASMITMLAMVKWLERVAK
ncbi:MAG: peptide MFS transporter [Porphyromonas sp.]|uniref:peptide MFS transporter n=1 Tax=uncultured Porphyromonas sp. TaxID=159274 RepID=UPI001CAC4E17|nr:peptide MFS transporter [uncultured Porphyromonas sp.]MBF1274634.1 peptide MFS transporter [Porphyromonadaceae bacterium]MBS5871953.1 peptide MFS transporter [Porphyromonas sp.]